MAERRIQPYGTWASPITAALLVERTRGVSELQLDGEDVYWLEARPSEGGRMVVVQRDRAGVLHDRTPEGMNARTRVHEYGGASYGVYQGVVYFSNFADNRLYQLAPGGEPVAVSAEAPMRYANPVLDGQRQRLIAIREDHTVDRPSDVVNTLVAIDLAAGHRQVVLASGHDFYAWPRLSPDGRQLAWLCWDHPNMPWDGTELWVADVAADGSLSAQRQVAGGSQESIAQPSWSPSGQLHFISDRTGWWNLYRAEATGAVPLLPLAAEFSGPQWSCEMSTYAFLAGGRILAIYQADGRAHLVVIKPDGTSREVAQPYAALASLKVRGQVAVMLAASAQEPPAVVRWDEESGRFERLWETMALDIDRAFLSVPEAITFPTTGGESAHAFYYPPTNPDFRAPAGERPPLLTFIHGGPTSATSPVLDLAIQFWTSRGFAVVNVNYRGSTGFGRAYRRRLIGQWGVADVDDCVSAARYLVAKGLADPKRLAIRGGSAGGYTTLAALTFRDVFRAGASYFGVSDITALAKETHKFESRYMDSLVGPYPAAEEIYRARSPVHFASRLTRPVIFFQGEDDKIVLPNQAEGMVAELQRGGVPVAYISFPGEGHGFRRAESNLRALSAELYFYGQVFGFEPADRLEPVEIHNRDRLREPKS